MKDCFSKHIFENPLQNILIQYYKNLVLISKREMEGKSNVFFQGGLGGGDKTAEVAVGGKEDDRRCTVRIRLFNGNLSFKSNSILLRIIEKDGSFSRF